MFHESWSRVAERIMARFAEEEDTCGPLRGHWEAVAVSDDAMDQASTQYDRAELTYITALASGPTPCHCPPGQYLRCI